MAYAAGYVGATPERGGALGGLPLNAAALRGGRYERASTVYIAGDAYIKRMVSGGLAPGVAVSGNGIRHAKPDGELVTPADLYGNGIRHAKPDGELVTPADLYGNGVRYAKPEGPVQPGVGIDADEERRSPARGDLYTPVDVTHTGEWVQLVKDVEPEPVKPGVSVSGNGVRYAKPEGPVSPGVDIRDAEHWLKRASDLWSSDKAAGVVNGFGAILNRAPLGGHPEKGQHWAGDRRVTPSVSIDIDAVYTVRFKPAQAYPGVHVTNVDGRTLVRGQRRYAGEGRVVASPAIRHRPSPRSWGGPALSIDSHEWAHFRPEGDVDLVVVLPAYATRRSVAAGAAAPGVKARGVERVTDDGGTVRVYAYAGVSPGCRVRHAPQGASASGEVGALASVTSYELRRTHTGSNMAPSVAVRSADEVPLRAARGDVAPGLAIQATGSGKRIRPAGGAAYLGILVDHAGQSVRARGEGTCVVPAAVSAGLLIRPVSASGEIRAGLLIEASQVSMHRAAEAALRPGVDVRLVLEISERAKAPAWRTLIAPGEPRTLSAPREHRTFEASDAMLLGSAHKQPADVLDYDLVLEDWLQGTDDVIQDVEVTISPEGELEVQQTTLYAERAKIWLKGGKDRTDYGVSILVTTAGGRKKEWEMNMRVRNR